MAQLKLPEKCDDEDGTAILCIAYLRQSDARFRQDWSHDVLRGATKTVYTSEDTSSGRVTVVPYWNNEKFAGNKALISEVPNDVNALEESLMYDKKSLHKVIGTTKDFTLTANGDRDTGIKVNYINNMK